MNQRMDAFKHMWLSKERKVNVKIMTTSGPCDVIFSGLKLVILKSRKPSYLVYYFLCCIYIIGLNSLNSTNTKMHKLVFTKQNKSLCINLCGALLVYISGSLPINM